MFTRGTRFWHTAIWSNYIISFVFVIPFHPLIISLALPWKMAMKRWLNPWEQRFNGLSDRITQGTPHWTKPIGTGQDFHRISISLWGQRWTYITQMTHLGFRSRSPEGPDFAALNCSKPQPGWIRRRRKAEATIAPTAISVEKACSENLWRSIFFGIWDITVYIHIYVYIYIYTHNFMLLLVLLFFKNRCWFWFRKVRNHKPF